MPKAKKIIGRYENVAFVSVADVVPVKIDTGALLSAVHCTSAKVFRKGTKRFLRFQIFGHRAMPEPITLETHDYSRVMVMSSSGVSVRRYLVTLPILMSGVSMKTSFTLADRSELLFPVLIGRTTLVNHFLVDVSITNVDRMQLRLNSGIKGRARLDDLE